MTTFGRDISCTSSLRTGRYATGLRLVAEAIYRRLTTPRGMLLGGEDEANYGLDLTGLIGSVRTASDAAALAGRITAEVKKDERVDSVDVIVTPTRSGAGISLGIDMRVTTAVGPFSLQLSVDDVSVQLVGLTEAA